MSTNVKIEIDGWTADVGTFALGRGFLTIGPDANDRIALVSPKGLPAQVQRAGEFVVGFDAHPGVRRIRIQGRGSPDGGWQTLADASGAALRPTDAGIAVKRVSDNRALAIDQVRVEITFATNTAKVLTRIAIL